MNTLLTLRRSYARANFVIKRWALSLSTWWSKRTAERLSPGAG